MKPTELYHYTDSKGIIGILGGKLWATEIGFLSDISEYRMALALILDLLKNQSASTYAPEDQILDQVIPLFIGMHESQVQGIFVASFTAEEGNKLSQWRSYCPIGGYSIGFNADYIRKSFGAMKCVYQPEMQRRLLQKSVFSYYQNEFLPWARQNLHLLEQDSSGFLQHQKYISFLGQVRAIAPQIKHYKYSEENEWRIAVTRNLDDCSIHFRQGRYFPVPYIELPIDVKQIQQIAIGPTPEKEITFLALRALMAKSGVTCRVVPASIPYRSW
jgi:hypothetical protein